jgi:hypothetical protein
MEECPVCYCETANCKLICGHSFCKTCVKTWFYKNEQEDASCPMCRRRLYFRGMYKVVPKWEEERIEQMQEEAFAEALEDVLLDIPVAEETDFGDDDSDSEWSFDGSSEETDSDWSYRDEEPVDYRMDDLLEIQERFGILNRAGVMINTDLLSSDWYSVFPDYERVFYEDDRSYRKNLFVSKHQGSLLKSFRCGKRIHEKNDFALMELVRC